MARTRQQRTSSAVPDDVPLWFQDNQTATQPPHDATTTNIDLGDYDPSTDADIWNLLNDSPDHHHHHHHHHHGNFDLPGTSHYHVESSNQNPNVPQTSFGNPVQISTWPVQPSPYTCTCCQTLRELVHTNGRQCEKLEIHGRVGLISHAVLDKYDIVGSSHHEYKMFDFCGQSIINVKKFMVQYCQDRQQEGYSLVNDPMALFYDVLIVGMNLENQKHQPTTPITSEGAVVDNENQPQRSSLAEQRERTGKLTLDDIERYFHLPIEEASKVMKVCPTVVKKICRRDGLGRWPYRKINSLNKKIAEKREIVNTTHDARQRAQAQEELQKLEQELREVTSR